MDEEAGEVIAGGDGMMNNVSEQVVNGVARPDAGKQREVRNANTRCDFWKSFLGLDEWLIKVIYKSQKGLGDSISDGAVEIFPEHKRAVVSLLPEVVHVFESQEGDYCPGWGPTTVDFILIHELLHIKFYYESFDGRDAELFEQSINSLARTILKCVDARDKFMAERADFFEDRRVAQVAHKLSYDESIKLKVEVATLKKEVARYKMEELKRKKKSRKKGEGKGKVIIPTDPEKPTLIDTKDPARGMVLGLSGGK